MHTHIYYFTGTGNSLDIARQIAEQLPPCDLRPIAQAINDPQPIRGERIGLVFPVYMHRPPHIVAQFIRRIQAAQYVFAIVTNGGEPGKALLQTQATLRRNGLDLHAGFSVLMPDNYPVIAGALPEAAQQTRLQQAAAQCKRMTAIIQGGERHLDNETPPFQIYVWPGMLYWTAYLAVRRLDAAFRVEAQCNGCGVCQKVCPVQNITLANGKPTWQHRCESCMACLQWCPNQAIQFLSITRGRTRYHHPSVNLKAMIAQAQRR